MSYAVVCFALLLTASEPPLAQADMDAEQAAAVREIEQAARDFRILVYETYRTDRAQYDARRLPADELLEAWKSAGHPAAYREDVLKWYRDATQVATSGKAAMPAFPELPEAMPETVAGGKQNAADPTVAPHWTSPDRLNVPVRTTGDQTSLDHTGDALGQPAKVNPFDQPYSGPKNTPPSKILRSLQRALLSSASDEPEAANELADPDIEFTFPIPGEETIIPFESNPETVPQLNGPFNP